jgi:hypothetical protein
LVNRSIDSSRIGHGAGYFCDMCLDRSGIGRSVTSSEYRSRDALKDVASIGRWVIDEDTLVIWAGRDNEIGANSGLRHRGHPFVWDIPPCQSEFSNREQRSGVGLGFGRD